MPGGIALALLELAHATGEDRFREAAAQGCVYDPAGVAPILVLDPA